jgi:hypothetical protein
MNKEFKKQKVNLETERYLKLLNYNKNRYFQLLNEKPLNKDESKELFEYSVLQEIQIEWQTAHQYYNLLEQFVEENLSMGDFCNQFLKRDALNSQTRAILESNLILLSPHEKSLDFSDLLDLLEEIYWTCEQLDGDGENSENIFRNSIKESFLKIQNYLNLKSPI